MTIDEAIRYLGVHSSTNGSGLCTDEQHYEAKQMAIKALEREQKFLDAGYKDGTMTIDEAKKMIEAKLKCMERDVSGTDDDCNNRRCYECPLNYEQGNMGEQKEWLRMAIQALEQTRWIPVSERLPEEETDVLICNVNGDIAISRGSYSTEMKNEFIWYTSGWRFGKVTAWMPLPEPYKGE